MKSLNLTRMKNAKLPDIWGKFLLGPYDEEDRGTVLQMIILFIASDSREIRKLGYRLALLYTKHTSDSSAIHAVAAMEGLVPVTKISESKSEDHQEDTFVGLARSSFSETLKVGDIYLTAGQKLLAGLFIDNADQALSVVAPTSYGKSSLISTYLEQSSGNFCVIVPTKSLLAQTRRMLLHDLPHHLLQTRKIITHHEMYDASDTEIIAVLTQERFLRLLQISPTLTFEHLVIDESHNLLENNGRSRALASTLVLALHRNPLVRLKFLSPFIVNSENLRNRIHNFDIIHLGTNEYIKSELIYHIDFRGSPKAANSQFVYDQFMDRSYLTDNETAQSPYEYIIQNAGRKNIVYLNRPIKTHEVSKQLLKLLPVIESPEISKACSDLADYLNKDYLLISCIKKGVIFHHGSVPDNVRLYLENLYAKCDKIQFVITTSTLLEGVNLPAEKMFLLDIKKGNRNLSPSQLKNLIGRVSRFKEAFSAADTNGLLPEVHFVGSEHFPSVTKNIEGFLKKSLKEGKQDKDKVENPLLENSELTEKNEANLKEELTFLGNSEDGILSDSNHEYEKAKTKIGKLCYLNRIADFNVTNIESSMDRIVTILKRLGTTAKDSKGLIEMINEVFLKNFPEEQIHEDSDIARLRDSLKARDFYSMILEWRTEGLPYQRMIAHFIGYWKKIETHPIQKIVFAGSWGTRPRELDSNSIFKKYVDIARLSHAERVTLAIARIEAEMSFLDYNVMKYIDCLSELDLIDPAYLDKLRFGTVEPEAKELMQAGMSHTLAKVMTRDHFRDYLIHYPSGAIGVSPKIVELMNSHEINSILINEAKYYIR